MSFNYSAAAPTASVFPCYSLSEVIVTCITTLLIENKLLNNFILSEFLMNIAIVGLIFSAFMPLVCSWISGSYRYYTLEGGVDNKNPRQQNTLLEGPGARAVSAQKNAWEAFVVYLAAMLAIILSGADAAVFSTAIVVYMISRVLHLVFYVINQDILRSFAFFGSFGSCLYMLFSVL